jgi:hypothetical protein
MPTLRELAIKYGSDKLYAHSYIEFYERLFAEMQQVERLLEIGIGFPELMTPFSPTWVHGSSLRMWSEYFPEAEIFGCDIREDTLFNEGRIKTFCVDQSSYASLEKLRLTIGDDMDIIMDDGSHALHDQVLTFNVFKDSVRTDGVYIIEDVQEPERLVDLIGAGHIVRFDKRPDDVLVVLQK